MCSLDVMFTHFEFTTSYKKYKIPSHFSEIYSLGSSVSTLFPLMLDVKLKIEVDMCAIYYFSYE